MKIRRIILSAGLLAASALALAHNGAKHDAGKPALTEKAQQPWGVAGEAPAATRDIVVRMTDAMRFEPDRIEVRQGETIRFRHHNTGQVMHEMVIGTKAALAEHAALMEKFPGMEHDEPWMAHVAPGGHGEIVWTFNRAGTFEFACLIPGHYQAGMIGTIAVLGN